MSTVRVEPRVGSGWVGLGRFLLITAGRIGSEILEYLIFW